MFNPHYCGFKQLPWIANVCGIPEYSRSGSRESHHGKLISNTHNPAVVQKVCWLRHMLEYRLYQFKWKDVEEHSSAR